MTEPTTPSGAATTPAEDAAGGAPADSAPASDASKIRTRVWAIVRTAVGAALLIWLIVSGALDWRALGGLFREWPLTLGAFGLLSIALIGVAGRLTVLLGAQGFHLSLWSSVRLTLIGIFFNMCLPGAAGGDVVRIYYATLGNEGRRMEVVTIMLLDRVVGMVALILWPLLVAPFFLEFVRANPPVATLLGLALAVVGGILLVGAVALSRRVPGLEALLRLLERLPGGHLVERGLRTLRGYRTRKSALGGALGLSLMAHTATMGSTLLIASAIGEFAWEVVLLVPLGFLANTLPLTPGGLGVGEAAFDALFGLAGLSGGAEILLGWRLLTILMGLAGLAFYLGGKRQFVRAARSETPDVE